MPTNIPVLSEKTSQLQAKIYLLGFAGRKQEKRCQNLFDGLAPTPEIFFFFFF
jgi:hypothetical protein